MYVKGKETTDKMEKEERARSFRTFEMSLKCSEVTLLKEIASHKLSALHFEAGLLFYEV